MGKRSREKRARRDVQGSGDRTAEAARDRPRGTPRSSRRGRWRALSLVTLHVAIGAHIAHWLIAKTTLTPLEPSEVMQTFSQGLVNAGALLFAASIVTTAIFGRFFCGWGCHIVALQDLCSWVLGKVGLSPRPFRSRLLVFMPLLAAIFMFVLPTLTRLWVGGAVPEATLHLYTDDLWDRFPSWPVALLTLSICGFGIVYLLGNKAFCTYACPYGGVFGLVEPLAPVRIRVTDACDGCGHCTASCTSNVRVHEEVRIHRMVVDPGCMKCTDCVSVCPKEALYVGLGRPAIGRPPPVAEPKPLRPSYSWPEETGLAVAFLLSTAILRKLYDAVPFLLSLALAAISAHALLTAWRLRRRGQVFYGRFELKRAGTLTRSGRAFAALAVLWVVFLGHSAWIQYLTLAGTARLDASVATFEAAKARGEAGDASGIERAMRQLDLADRYGLVPVANLLGVLARGSTRLGRQDAAEAYFQRAVEASPDYAFARLELAHYARARGDVEEHLRLLRMALRSDPELPGAHEELVRVLAKAGQLGLAQRELEALLAERPSSAAIRRSYAMLLANRGDVASGLAQTRRVVENEPRDAVARYNLVLLLANQARFAEAHAACGPLSELRPNDEAVLELCRRVSAQLDAR